ncbi:NADH-quinone oxidoreductase subunit NuoE [Bradyrhizobium sp. LHD-71]|uniref:NADH-quinone oxidoreductase subunit NuoE n=1 Tax=Bradyrhizobium sp. LHD-71 TaxID=3072141 RepID=UPI00280FA8F5|nr:NADH-quinone oxidoreductase subunit NuoE [Bradyrhizobium sp. LHD-71]MDQ8728741.1 NADH-quinone oxidoreductase subunit NuoE [Bradyrhizobium sp. LHD-71]
MAVRRLAPKELQPASFAFSDENLAWAKERIAKYPERRQASAVIPILWRAQEQVGGWLPEAAIRTVADMLDMPYIRVLEVATFYTQFQLQPVGKKAHVQVCGTTPCQLRGASELIALCKRRIHHDPFHVSADGDFSWEEVECLGACVNAPMVLIGKDTYEDLTTESFGKVLDGLAAGKPPKPGPQNGRQFSAPIDGITTLKTDVAANAGAKPAKEPVVADAEAKKPGEAANTQERPAPKPPSGDATAKTS